MEEDTHVGKRLAGLSLLEMLAPVHRRLQVASEEMRPHALAGESYEMCFIDVRKEVSQRDANIVCDLEPIDRTSASGRSVACEGLMARVAHAFRWTSESYAGQATLDESSSFEFFSKESVGTTAGLAGDVERAFRTTLGASEAAERSDALLRTARTLEGGGVWIRNNLEVSRSTGAVEKRSCSNRRLAGNSRHEVAGEDSGCSGARHALHATQVVELAAVAVFREEKPEGQTTGDAGQENHEDPGKAHRLVH